jgi:hypothetical protein
VIYHWAGAFVNITTYFATTTQYGKITVKYGLTSYGNLPYTALFAVTFIVISQQPRIRDQGHAAQNGHSHPPREDQPLLRAPELESWVPPRGFLWIEAAIMANVFLYGFDTTITAAMYAVISSDFDAANTASWLTTSYLLDITFFDLSLVFSYVIAYNLLYVLKALCLR